MKKKLLGIFVCMLLIATALPAVGIMTNREYNSNNQTICGRGGLFRQLPYLPNDPKMDSWGSDEAWDMICYDDFRDIASPICDIHWWGHSLISDGGKIYDCDPTGMTFDITFYEDNNSMPGDIVCSYDDVSPTITPTNIKYDWSEVPGLDIYEMHYFEVELSPCCNMSDGWVSIVGTGSDNDCFFSFLCSPDGNSIAYQLMEGELVERDDFAFMLTDGEETSLEMDVTGGLGVTVEITNIGDETLTDIPIDIVIFGGLFGRIEVQVEESMNLNPGDTASVGTGLFLGLGKIAIGLIADDVVEYPSGLQLLIFTIIQ